MLLSLVELRLKSEQFLKQEFLPVLLSLVELELESKLNDLNAMRLLCVRGLSAEEWNMLGGGKEAFCC